ncbi:MAG: hypothetical protein U1B80_09555, partial [Anaerolineaceae bacterium]|nr:hypothetical protein [Anaerolineaceae bacterium]
TSTVPTTYQIYYHFAQDSIPPALRVRGTEVLQGQFIGIADNTGPSTGHHLHFHVHTNANAYWGSSVDITFDDVKINGGRPRTCTEAKNFPKYGAECVSGNWLLSGNGDMERPTGGISQPSAGTVITKATRSVSGWGRDDKAVQSMQLLVTYDGNWKPIGPVLKESPFTIPIDLCKAGIPDGEFFLSLQVMDTSGKLSQPLTGLTPLIKQYDCFPPPTPTPMPGCIPAEDGAAVYTGANYQGSCSTLKIGEYTKRSRFGDLGGKSIRSILVGSNAAVELFAGENFTGERLVVFESQLDIEKYPVGVDGVDSMIIRQRPAVPAPPVLVTPSNVDGLAPDDTDQLTLTWNGAEGAEEHRSELLGAEGFKLTQEWQKEMRWNVGTLPAGEYTWTVWSRNIIGESSASINFEVDLHKPLPESQLEPLAKLTRSTAVELRWVIKDEASPAKFEIQYRVTGSEWKDWRSEIEGSQRRVWFFGNPGKHYEFRMRAVGANGKAEPYPEFAEAETEIEAECTPDSFDVSLTGNNDPGNPTPLDVGVNQSHNICGSGDQDWIVFMGEMGKSYRIQTTPDGGAAVIIELYGGDDASLLGSQSPSDLGKATQLDWIAPGDGLYYLRLQPIDERLNGTETGYSLRIDPMGQVYTPTLLCGGLALPGLWMLVKLFLALRARMRRE